MQKNNIRMVVQSIDETAKQFAERLELICYDICIEHKKKIQTPPIVFLTAAGDGRQTATLQFMTTVTDKTKEHAFNGFHLRVAYSRFKEKEYKTTPETDALVEFLLQEIIDDFVNE